MATKNVEVNGMNYEAECTKLQSEVTKLMDENQALQKQLGHFVDEMRFLLGIAVQARPEMEEIKVMARELYRIAE